MTIAYYAYTALDCENPVELAHFYSRITGLKVQPFDEGETAQTCEWLELLDENNRTKMAFQKIDNYHAPTWPQGDIPQQVHMDFHAKDLDIAEKELLELGAIKTEFQPKPHRFRVYLDIAGHPFCIVQSDKD
ncbi:glyoxalase [Actinobacteria bacterium IMCC26103]|nr:glyoxalase [Actinobacteria bacterium IMCC26103]